MTVLKPRTRMICVRLSEEEFSALRRLCIVTGARSVSDLTRDAMQALLNNANRQIVPGNYMDEFSAQIMNLNNKIEGLVATVATIRAGNKD